MVSNNDFTIIVPLDDVYQTHMPRDRHMIEVWLNGMVSPYSIALAFVDIRNKKGNNNDDDLWSTLEWLPNVAERKLVHQYIRTLTDILQAYVLPILGQERLTLEDIQLVNHHETIINEWNCGNVSLRFNVRESNPTSYIVGTPYPPQHYLSPTPLSITNTAQVPVPSVYAHY